MAASDRVRQKAVERKPTVQATPRKLDSVRQARDLAPEGWHVPKSHPKPVNYRVDLQNSRAYSFAALTLRFGFWGRWRHPGRPSGIPTAPRRAKLLNGAASAAQPRTMALFLLSILGSWTFAERWKEGDVDQCDTMENFYTELQMNYRVSRIWLSSSQRGYFRPRDQDLNVDTTVCQVVASDLLREGELRCQACRWFNMDMEPFSEDPGHLDEGIPVKYCLGGSHMDEKDPHAWLRRDALVQRRKYAALCVPPMDATGGLANTNTAMGQMGGSSTAGAQPYPTNNLV